MEPGSRRLGEGEAVSIIMRGDIEIEDCLKYYGAHFYCSNCGHSRQEHVKKGVKARGVTEICPNCGCFTYKA